jgi:hypothetical protein
VNQFGAGPSALRTAIQTQLTAIGSPLTPDNIVARSMALSCAGCHQLSNGANLGGGLFWPPSAGFTHVDERTTVAGPNGPRFPQSPALTGTFLPHRSVVFQAYLNLTQPFFRLFDPVTNARVYTLSAAEKAAKLGAGWIDEGNAGFPYPAPTLGSAPLFRLFNPITGDRIYTTSSAEKGALTGAGWSDEGTSSNVFTGPAPGAVPLFRLYDAVGDRHLYTVSPGEKATLLGAGWTDQGTAGWLHTS